MILAFSFGVFVGYHRARFSYSWKENYDRNFGSMMPFGPITGDGPFGFIRGKFINAHGVVGKVESINGNALAIKDKDNNDKIIIASSTTVISDASGTLQLQDIKVNNQIIAIGTPNNQGQIEARLIRVNSN